MKFIISGKNITVSQGLKTAVEDKLGKLERYFTPDTEVVVTLSVEKERQKIEVTIPMKGNIIRSEQVSNDMYVSIDLVEEVIERQLRKYKNKIVDKQQAAANFQKEYLDKDYEEDEEFTKIEDCYTVGRGKIKEKMPLNVQKYSDYILIIPDIVALIYRLLKDKRVPVKTKIIISSVICYIAVPSDLIPDKIPFIGKIDDIAVVFFALNKIIQDVPAKVILENWEGKNNIVSVLKTLAQYVTDFTRAKNVETIYGIIDEIVSI